MVVCIPSITYSFKALLNLNIASSLVFPWTTNLLINGDIDEYSLSKGPLASFITARRDVGEGDVTPFAPAPGESPFNQVIDVGGAWALATMLVGVPTSHIYDLVFVASWAGAWIGSLWFYARTPGQDPNNMPGLPDQPSEPTKGTYSLHQADDKTSYITYTEVNSYCYNSCMLGVDPVLGRTGTFQFSPYNGYNFVISNDITLKYVHYG